MRRVVALLTLQWVVGCGIDVDAPRSLPDKVVRAREQMHQRFAATSEITRALAFGDLDRARTSARSVVSLDEPNVLPAWVPYFDNVKQAAARVAEADDLTTAAKALADVGVRCARCHAATEARIKFDAAPMPTRTRRLSEQMAEHEWAVERMWEGLIAGDDARWLAGASALAGARLAITAEEGSLGIADDMARVHAYATNARKLQTTDDRALVFGHLMATCAHCHSMIRDRW